MFILPKKIFSLLDRTAFNDATGELFLTDAVDIVCQTMDVYPYYTDLPLRDTGNMQSYLSAWKHFSLHGSLFN